MASTYCQIKDLALHSRSFFINAVVIAKTEKKMFQSGRNSGVINFTVRDTKHHFINCSVWGSESFIENSYRAFKIGDLISICNPSVVQKNTSSPYHPRTTSPFELKVSEGKSYIHRGEHSSELLQLKNQAIKSTSLALKLDDLNFRIGSDILNADFVALVRAVDPVREVKTKFGQKTMRKVYLMDKTMESIVMTVWHAEWQLRMNHWKPLETVLHLVDVKAEHSDFERSTVLSVTSKTIIVENPVHSSRSNELLAYIHSLPLDKINELKNSSAKPSIKAASITEVKSVRRIIDEIHRNGNEIAAIVYAVIAKFDINSATAKSCVHCNRMLFRDQNDCGSESCKSIDTNEPRYVNKVYMAVSITDHSGTMNCRIIDENAQKTIGHTAQQLMEFSEDDVDAIFNRFMLERFAVKVIVRPKSELDYFASIVSIETERSNVIAEKIKP